LATPNYGYEKRQKELAKKKKKEEKLKHMAERMGGVGAGDAAPDDDAGADEGSASGPDFPLQS
jgi:hypothetical protein